MKLLSTTPALPVKSIKNAIEFYTEKLGFQCVSEDQNYGVIKRDEIELHLWVANNKNWMWKNIFLFLRPVKIGCESFLSGTQSCRVQVDDIKSLFSELKPFELLHKSSKELLTTSWSTIEFSITDLYGNLLTFYENIEIN